jgi:hypothetical protein
MDMILTLLNSLLALGTIALGLFGLLRPDQTMAYIGTKATDETGLAKSEVRAASGGLWVASGLAALLIFTPTAFVMLGALWTGAAIGRGTAVLVDKANTGKPLIFFLVEAVFAVVLLALNVPALMS